MASFVKFESVTAGNTFTMPHDGFIAIGANGGEVTVGITIDGTVFDYDTTITDGTLKGIEIPLPQGSVITIQNANAKIMAYGK